MTDRPKDTDGAVRYPDAWCGHMLDRPFPDLEMKVSEKPYYADFYNSYGMMDDRSMRRFMALSDVGRRAILDEHHRRSTAIAEAWAERGEVIDRHDPRFDDAAQGTPTNG